jgi:hypothetical protein
MEHIIKSGKEKEIKFVLLIYRVNDYFNIKCVVNCKTLI